MAMFRRKGILKKRHYLLILFAIIVVAFFQPFVLLVGNLVIVFGIAVYIYTDLTPEAQDELENRVASGMKNMRDYLRRSPAETNENQIPAPQPAKRGRFNGLLSRSKPPRDNVDEETPPPIVDAEIIREHDTERDTRH